MHTSLCLLTLLAGLARAAEPVLIVVNKHEDTLALVNPRTLTVIEKIPVGHDPHELVITPDGRHAYLSNYAAPGDTVSLVDLIARRHVRQIPTGRYARIHSAAIAPDGRFVYFTAGQTGFVVEIDTRQNQVTRGIPTHGEISHMVEVSPDGRRLYTANIETRNVSVIDRSSGELIAQIPCDRGCEGITFTPDGKMLWAANQDAGNITLIDVATHKAIDTLPCPGRPLRIRFTKDGRRALISNWLAQGEVVVFDVPARREIKRLRVGNQPIGLLITPDEERAFVTNMSSDEVHVIDLRALEVAGRFETGKGPDAMAWWIPPDAAISRPSAGTQSGASSEHPLIGVYGGAGNPGKLKAIETGVDFLMPSITWYEPNPWLKDLVVQLRPHGIKLYPSLAMAYDGYGDKQSDFARAHPQFWEKRRDGSLIDRGDQVSLSWGYPEVRAYKVETVRKLAESSGIDGVLLDYTRFFGSAAGYSDIIVREFREKDGRDPLTVPVDDPAWLRFRADYVTRFVADLRTALDGVRPGIRIIACVNPDPAETLRESMQDWATWVNRGLIDGVVTMIYERDTNNTLRSVMIANAAAAGRVPHIPMIAPYGGNLTTPELLEEASLKCLAAGTGGVAFYREDSIFEHNLWDTLREIAHWNLKEVSARPVNHVLNAGFERGLEHWSIGAGEGVEVVVGRARTGAGCLRLHGTGVRAVRQVIDRGFRPDRRGMHLSLWAERSAPAAESRVFVKVETVMHDGHEDRFRIPVAPPPRPGWQQIEADLPLRRPGSLKFVTLTLGDENPGGDFFIDDVDLSFTAASPASPDRYRDPLSSGALTAGPNVNIARGQIVRGSSFWENGFEFARAVDGNLSNEDYGKGSAWHSQRPARNQWIVIHLPDRYAVTRIRMLNASAQSAYRTRDYQIETSLNDRDYQIVSKGILPDDAGTWTQITLAPTPARYIRFTGVTGYNPDYAIGLKEIEVYAE